MKDIFQVLELEWDTYAGGCDMENLQGSVRDQLLRVIESVPDIKDDHSLRKRVDEVCHATYMSTMEAAAALTEIQSDVYHALKGHPEVSRVVVEIATIIARRFPGDKTSRKRRKIALKPDIENAENVTPHAEKVETRKRTAAEEDVSPITKRQEFGSPRECFLSKGFNNGQAQILEQIEHAALAKGSSIRSLPVNVLWNIGRYSDVLRHTSYLEQAITCLKTSMNATEKFFFFIQSVPKEMQDDFFSQPEYPHTLEAITNEEIRRLGAIYPVARQINHQEVRALLADPLEINFVCKFFDKITDSYVQALFPNVVSAYKQIGTMEL